MTIMRGNVPMLPTNVVRLNHLAKVCNDLQFELERELNILEIGSLLGDSAIILAKFGHVLCVDLWDYEGGLETFLHNVQHRNIGFIQGSSVDILPTLPTGEYDLIYVDGDHTYPVVLSDLEQAKRLVTHEGIICGDDLEHQLAEKDIDTVYRLRFIDYTNGYHPGVALAVNELFGHVNMIDGFWWWQNEP